MQFLNPILIIICKIKQIRIKEAGDTVLSESGCKFFYQCPYSTSKCINESKLSEEEEDLLCAFFYLPSTDLISASDS